MRILLVTACLIALVISAWSNYSSVADAKLRGDFTDQPDEPDDLHGSLARPAIRRVLIAYATRQTAGQCPAVLFL